MQFNIDKRFIKLLNLYGGYCVTWEHFRAAYDLRRSERDASSTKKRKPLLNPNELAFYEALIASENPGLLCDSVLPHLT